MRLIKTGTYRQDLEAIVDHIARESPKAALAIWDEIERQVERLAAYPNSGRMGRVEGTRELVVNKTPYVVGYSVSNEATLILRVLHGAQQWPGDLEPKVD